MNTYLGQKGYSILKSELSVEEQIKIREELNVGAYMPKSIVQQAKFPVYRESPQKMYIPRYYGIKHFIISYRNIYEQLNYYYKWQK